ncbi:MAG: hypothetical protein ACI8T1_005180 [Verrucomicrobiales bacterium]|jgi:hypothetical protein
MLNISFKNSPILLIKPAIRVNTATVMANSPQGKPEDFKNLSPFAGSKKAKAGGSGSKGILLLGALGILAALALLFCALALKAS